LGLMEFQSTLPVGGATIPQTALTASGLFQSTLPVGGATRPFLRHRRIKNNFNPRSPWGERRPYRVFAVLKEIFQSTLPVGGATRAGKNHPLPQVNFNPRSPWGERLTKCCATATCHRFQSTLPVGGATSKRLVPAANGRISIHAPRGGSDDLSIESSFLPGDFNPRSPWGERLGGGVGCDTDKHFNPRSPWGERRCLQRLLVYRLNFNPRSPWGERRLSCNRPVL